MAEQTEKTRLFFLDWLRVLAFGLLVFYHTGLIFADWGFHIRNNSFSEPLKLPMLFVNQWRLPLLFFVSGAGICFALGKRTTSEFARERVVRIVVPLIAGVILIIPPQLFYEWLQKGLFKGNYWQFYPLFFQHITWNHLWFLVYLLAYTICLLPLFLSLRQEKNKTRIKRIATFLLKRNLLILLVIPLLLTELFLRARWPDNRNLVGDWYNFTFYLLFMLYGYSFAVSGSLWYEAKNNRRKYLTLGLFSFAMIYFGRQQPGINFLETSATGPFIFDFFKCFNIFCWIICLVGYAGQYLNENSPSLQYSNKAVYPFFILHQTVLIMIGFYVIQLDWNILSKYITIVAGTFLITLLVYAFLLRRSKVLGFLFGLNNDCSYKNSVEWQGSEMSVSDFNNLC